jgi:hypothetical protein
MAFRGWSLSAGVVWLLVLVLSLAAVGTPQLVQLTLVEYGEQVKLQVGVLRACGSVGSSTVCDAVSTDCSVSGSYNGQSFHIQIVNSASSDCQEYQSAAALSIIGVVASAAALCLPFAALAQKAGTRRTLFQVLRVAAWAAGCLSSLSLLCSFAIVADLEGKLSSAAPNSDVSYGASFGLLVTAWLLSLAAVPLAGVAMAREEGMDCNCCRCDLGEDTAPQQPQQHMAARADMEGQVRQMRPQELQQGSSQLQMVPAPPAYSMQESREGQ